MNVLVLGYGVVGQGVVSLLDQDTIFDVDAIYTRETLDDNRQIDDVISYLKTDKAQIVVEALGGIEPAFSLSLLALENKKHVVTSNKELVAKKGAILLKAARDNGVNFLFEASVGGGMPLLSVLDFSLKHDQIISIQGILNGTTNYILTEMMENKISFEDALKKAQCLGYAELDPSDDVQGRDTARKIAILGSILMGHTLHYEDINVKGIESLNQENIKQVTSMNKKIRLVASVRRYNGTLEAWVSPVVVDMHHSFYGVEGVDNAVIIETKAAGEIMIKGQGAGRYPTASSILADIYSCQYDNVNRSFWDEEIIKPVLHDFDVLIKTNAHKMMVVRQSETQDKEGLRVV